MKIFLNIQRMIKNFVNKTFIINFDFVNKTFIVIFKQVKCFIKVGGSNPTTYMLFSTQ